MFNNFNFRYAIVIILTSVCFLLSGVNLIVITLTSLFVALTKKSKFVTFSYMLFLILSSYQPYARTTAALIFTFMLILVIDTFVRSILSKEYFSGLSLLVSYVFLLAIGYGFAFNSNPTESFQFYNLIVGGSISSLFLLPIVHLKNERRKNFFNKFFE